MSKEFDEAAKENAMRIFDKALELASRSGFPGYELCEYLPMANGSLAMHEYKVCVVKCCLRSGDSEPLFIVKYDNHYPVKGLVGYETRWAVAKLSALRKIVV